jgi:membrane associated rhomboid family serine protease
VIPIKDIIPPRSTPWIAVSVLVLGAIEWTVATALALPLRQSAFYLVANSLVFWLFADNVEDRLGRGRFITLYLVCHVAALLARSRIASSALLPILLSSGAVAGVCGAYFVLYPRSRILMLLPVPVELYEMPAVFCLAVFFALQVPAGTTAIVEVGAGFVAGAALSLAFRKPVAW